MCALAFRVQFVAHGSWLPVNPVSLEKQPVPHVPSFQYLQRYVTAVLAPRIICFMSNQSDLLNCRLMEVHVQGVL